MKKTIIIIAIVFAASLVGAVLLSASDKPPAATGGNLVVEPATTEWGTIGLQPVTTTIAIRNAGTTPLTITKVSTSCACTTAALSIGGRTTQKYGMDHGGLAPTNVKLDAGQTGELIVTFDPLFHENTQGPVERVVYLRTDNPGQPEVEASFRGTVVR